ncbi:hypothetical protein [Mesorhizobium australicum]|uniref:hypothetical protein n=2 Tax=Mesorhizobium australicum TaxID=536018 RepID=UPI0033398DCA
MTLLQFPAGLLINSENFKGRFEAFEALFRSKPRLRTRVALRLVAIDTANLRLVQRKQESVMDSFVKTFANTLASSAVIIALSLPATAAGGIGVGAGASVGGSRGVNAGIGASVGGSGGIGAGAGASIGVRVA